MRLAGLAICAGLAAPAAAGPPLSAIEWLTERLAEEAPAPPAEPGAASVPLPAGGEIATGPLAAGRADAVGLFPVAAAGLPADLWAGSQAGVLATALGRELADLPVAARDLYYLLLIGEAAPPLPGAGEDGAFLLARIDRLAAWGAIEPALALIEASGTGPAERLRRYVDFALLLDEEERACTAVRARSDLPAGLAALVFCLARTGDWGAATLAFRAGQGLGLVDDGEARLVARFLDLPDFGVEAPLEPPARPSPMAWRLHEAIGEALPTAALPLAFAHADLESAAGWRAQIAAAERLYRAGAIPANRLVGIYGDRAPAASGGVWERVGAVQRLEAALEADGQDALAAALPEAWDRLAEAGIEVLLPEFFGVRLAGRALSGPAGDLAFRIALLSDAAAGAARGRAAADAGEAFLVAVALGRTAGFRPPDALSLAIRDGLAGAAAPPGLADAVAGGRVGEALIEALARLDEGARGDPRGIGVGLSTLVVLGLDGVARRVALQLMLLGERG